MRPFLFFVGVLGLCAQTVSSIRTDGVGDSSARVWFNVNTSYNALRMRYGTSDCAGGAGTLNVEIGTATGEFTLYNMTAQVAGLAPATTYYVCPEVSSNGGSSWSSGVSATVTTNARTTTLPIAPTAVNTTFPAVSGATHTVASDCSDAGAGLQHWINAAAYGDQIVIPAGVICSGSYTLPISSTAKSFAASAVRTSDGRITLPAHGYSENQEVRVSSSGCLPGNAIIPYGLKCDLGGGWRKGAKYYVHSIDADHLQLLKAVSGTAVTPGWVNFTADPVTDTITYVPQVPSGMYSGGESEGSVGANKLVQFVSSTTLPAGLSLNTNYYLLDACAANANAACTTHVAATSGGAAINITSAGTGTHTMVDQGTGTHYIDQAPDPTAPYIRIKSPSCPPEGTRLDPEWASLFGHIRQDTPMESVYRIYTGILSRNWLFECLTIDTGTNDDYLYTSDPRPYGTLIFTWMDSSNIRFDRINFAGPCYPNRLGYPAATAVRMDGENVGFSNSRLTCMDYWKPSIASGLTVARVNNTQFTIAAGTVHGGVFSTTLTGTGTFNITNGASYTGTGYVYFAMDGSLKTLLSTSMTGNCSVTGATCAILTSGSPNWPTVSIGGWDRRAGVAVATLNFTGGNLVSVAASDPSGPPDPPEGANTFLMGNGPGPYAWYNNFQEGAGLNAHWDDSGGPFAPRGDYTVTHNFFNFPAKYRQGAIGSDDLNYNHRQPIEWKGGDRILVRGNIFNGQLRQNNPDAVALVITPRSNGHTTDVDVQFNWIRHSPAGLGICRTFDSHVPVSKPCARMRYSNNLMTDIDGYAYHALPNPGFASNGGWAFLAGYGSEDLLIEHNTIIAPTGTNPNFFHMANQPIGGWSAKSNVAYRGIDGQFLVGEHVPNCSLTEYALAQCSLTNGPGNPAYTLTDNWLVTGYTDNQAKTGVFSAATICTEWNGCAGSGAIHNVITGASVAAATTALGYVNPAAYDFHVASGSPLENACDGGTKNCGVDFEALLNAAGIVRDIVVTPAAGGVVITYKAPDSRQCWIGLSTTSDIEDFVWISDSGGSTSRMFSSSSLMGSTLYYRKIRCYADQPASLEFSADQITDGTFTSGASLGPLPQINGATVIDGGAVIN